MNRNELIALRDRIGLLSENDARNALQRLTWIMDDPSVIGTAIDDVQNPRV